MQKPPYTLVNDTPVKGVSFYRSSKTFQSISWDLTNFVGTVEIQATLVEEPEESDYFAIYTIGDGITPLTVVGGTASIQGNFVWVRAKPQIVSGTVDLLTVNF